MATPYQLPSSFSGGMQGAIDSLKRGQLPQSIMSPVKDSSKVKQTILPKKNVPKKWTVKIDDGSTLQFDNEPTPQDIEEAFAQMKAPQPKAPIFQDKYAGEGSVMQTLKALPRAALETGKQVVGNLQGAFESGSNVINSGVSSAYKGVTGRQLPGFGTAESGFTEQKQKFDVPSNLAQFGASATGLATQATPVGLSTNLGFNLAAELPGVQYAPQAIGAGIQGASNIVSDVTGISPEITQNLTTTALNTLFLRSAGKQSAPISQAYAKSGQLGALKELGMSVPRTTVDIAKQPIQAVIGTAKIPFKIADWAIGKTAQGLLTNKTGTQELFQASSPSINKIGNKSLGLDKLREKSAIADETIVKLGYRPKNTTERAEAYQSAMGDIWNQIEQVRGGVSEKFSGKQLGAYLRDRIEKSKVNGKLSPSQQRDANTLNDWATYYESLGDFDTPTLSGIRTQINGETTWNKKLDNGDLFNKTFQDLAAVVRKTENNVIDSAKGGQFQDLMNRYGALTTLLEDVIKQDIKLQRAKGEGLTTTYSRIEGIGDVLKGGIGLIKEPVTGLSNIASGLGKLAVGKTLAKLKDTDFLIENGYNKLYKSLGLDKGKGKLPTKKVYQEPEGLKPIQESSNIPKSSPVNNTQKEASKATLPKVEQKQTEVSKSVLPGNKVNTPIIPKTEVKANLPKESKLPKKQNDWTKKDFTKATETKSVDKYGNTIAREQGKTSAVDSITVGGKKYTNIDIPDSSRTLYELDGKIYEYKDGKMISEGANLPKTPQEGKTAKEAKLDATINKQLIEEAKNHTDFVDFFQSKLGDKQPTKENLMKLGFSAEDIARNTDSLGISLEDLFHEIKTGKLSSYPAKPKQSLPLSQKSEVKYSEPMDSLASEAKKYKSAEEFIKKEAIRKRLIKEGTKINPDDTVTLYHATGNKEDILKQGEFKGTRAQPGGMVGVDLGGNIVYFGTDKKWVNDTWSRGKSFGIVEVKVPLEYIRKPAENKLEVYFEGGLKRKGDIWIPGVKPQSTHYDRIAEIELLSDKEKQQLLDIYNKANKKPPLPLSQKSEVKYSKPIDLSDAESDLIFDYTKSGGGTSKPMGIEKQKKVSNVIKKLPENTDTVYSGQKPSNETISELESGEFTSKRLISSSTEKRIAQEFMDYNPNQRNQAFFTIEGGGHDISKFSQFNHSIGGEKEILFPIGTKFKVEKTGSNTYTLYPQ